ncbi:hypothetical protein V1281_004729 [Nitrobacteraceae bacterium AZCC 2161]
MALYSLSGTISQLGQCEFDNDLVVYANVGVARPHANREAGAEAENAARRHCTEK